MGVEQHFVALRRVRLNDERLAIAKLQVRHHQLPPDAADDQMLFAPVELVRFSRGKLQGYERFGDGYAATFSPLADELGDPAVIAVKPQELQLGMKLQGRSSVSHRTACVRFQHLDQTLGKGRDLGFRRPSCGSSAQRLPAPSATSGSSSASGPSVARSPTDSARRGNAVFLLSPANSW
jgi:hypothetical protein